MVRSIVSMLTSSALVGPGDDAAAIGIGDRYLVASTDMLWEGTHFHPRMSWWQKGWMAAAVNLSDIAAMGAQPLGLLLALGLPCDLDEEHVMEMVKGALDCCDRNGADYLGGDTKECSQLVITGTSLGLVPKDGILKRKGAAPGDLLMMTGEAGLASAGLLGLQSGVYEGRAVKALFEPQPRIKEGVLLSSTGAVTSCIDTSDGLSTSLIELSEASGVAFELDIDSLAVAKEVQVLASMSGQDPWRLVLHGGGDYQLLFTVRSDAADEVARALGGDANVIGRCVPGKENYLLRGGTRSPLEPLGYEHFRR